MTATLPRRRTVPILALATLAGFACPELLAGPAITLASPRDFQVFQRQTATEGRVVVDGAIEPAVSNISRLEFRLIVESPSVTPPPAWQSSPVNPGARAFHAEMTAPAGGWYRFELRLTDGGQVLATAAVEHVGVGEVFLVAGQSNSANHGEERQRPSSPLVAAFAGGPWQPANDPQPGASGGGGSFLPALGDALAEHFKVPIGLVALGAGGTSVREWLPKGDPMAAPPTTGAHTVAVGTNAWASSGELFDSLTAAARRFGPRGFRALLWHQGESDNHQESKYEITPQQYRVYLQRLIEASRADAGWAFPWFVAEASYHTPEQPGSPELRAAQRSLVSDGLALAGPNTDDLAGDFRDNHGRGVHFSARGLREHGKLWAEKVTPWLEQRLRAETPK